MSRTSKHSGAIKALQFNHFRHELLASAGAKGEIYISDLNNVANPFRLGATAARADDYDCMDWNKKVPHILATGSSGGFAQVWDVKSKKESLTLNNQGRKAVSAIAWDPDVPTKLMTATSDDQEPLILMWDLRNSSTPEQTLSGHELGILSLSWCPQDTQLLLSCGKDNRTICWNPRSGRTFGEVSVVTNWTFETRWNPHHPNLFATASFDGKIAVQTIQNTNSKKEDASAVTQSLDGEDFFDKAQLQPQATSFSLSKAPKWMERPVSVSFGFGGKIVKLGLDASRKSKISIDTFAVDPQIVPVMEKFEEVLRGGDLASLCQKKIDEAATEEERADWQVIETLNAGKSRKKLREYLGFSDEIDELAMQTSHMGLNSDKSADGTAQVNGTTDDVSSFFESTSDGDGFLADLAATKGAKTNSPFHLFTGSETAADKRITQALIMGQFERALDICLQDGRMSDAFMIAICGGQKCVDKVQTAYLKKKAHGPNYLRLLASIVGKNLWDVVHNANLANWKEVMATLCTYADENEFSDLCEALGDRLEESMTNDVDSGTLRRDASFCYLAGSKLEKVVNIWVQELQEKEQAGLEASGGDSSFSVHARSLQDFIEKVTVFRKVVNFQDAEIRQPVPQWKLAPLYAKYIDFAGILSAHGKPEVAERYLNLLPPKYPTADDSQARVRQATRKAAARPVTGQPAARSTQRAQPGAPSFQTVQQTSFAPPKGETPIPYAPALPPTASQPSQPAQNLYAPPNAMNRAYGPTGYQQPPAYGQPSQYATSYHQPQQQQQQQPLPPPPR
ncbi:protein transport protein S31, partial [Elasticomyces elasticus]